MTLAPTIFAGFLARSYNNIGTIFEKDFQSILQGNLENANLSGAAQAELGQLGQQMSGGAQLSETELTQIVDAIQDPTLKEVINSSVAEITKIAAQNGFDGMYTTAAILGVLIIVLALILKPLRRNLA